MLGIFVFGDPFFSPAWSVLVRNGWLGTKSVQVTGIQCLQERVPPGPPSLLLSKTRLKEQR